LRVGRGIVDSTGEQLMEESEAPAAQLGGFEAALVRLAARAWPIKAAEEDRSQAIFIELLAAAHEVGLTAALKARLSGARDDEARHVRLCTHVGRTLGAPRPKLDRSGVAERVARVGPSAVARLLSLTSIEVAARETISCALLRAAAARATEPLTQWALHSILRDEGRHAQLGWECLEIVVPSAEDAALSGLRVQLPVALAAIEQVTAAPSLKQLDRRAPFDERLEALGVLAPQTCVQAFYEALEQRVLPRFDALGLGGTDAWARRYRA
jgi:hypothetical protein